MFVRMSDVHDLIARAKTYGCARGIALTTVSKLLFGDWRRIDAIESGKAFLRPPTLTTALERMAALEAQPAGKRKRARDTSEAANARDA